jgi:hypothetical protein
VLGVFAPDDALLCGKEVIKKGGLREERGDDRGSRRKKEARNDSADGRSTIEREKRK